MATNLADLRGPQQQRPQQMPAHRRQTAPAQVAPEASMPNISVGFGDLASWEFTQRVARALASSTLVPEAYRSRVKKKGRDEWVDNPNAIPNCIIALNMANRIGADPLMVMQNLYVVEGRPSWSSQFVISAINSCKRFTSMQFDVKEDGTKEVEYTATEWVNREKQVRKGKVTVRNMVCVAWATDLATGARLESPPVSMDMAVKEGWYTKNGSKWQTMPDLMIRYRAAAFFGRLFAPELLMGLRTAEENSDIVVDAELSEDGVWGAPAADPVVTDGEPIDNETGEFIDSTADNAPPPAQIESKPAVPMQPVQQPDRQAEKVETTQRAAAPAATTSAPPQQQASSQLPLGDDDGFGEAE